MTDERPRSPPQQTLAAKRLEEQQEGEEKRQREQRGARIGKRVLDTLGQPGDLYRVQVRPLWGDCYRVNVLVGADATSTRVAHSYFVQVDGGGNVVAATPPITKRYGEAAPALPPPVVGTALPGPA
jgi:hypothetical protein